MNRPAERSKYMATKTEVTFPSLEDYRKKRTITLKRLLALYDRAIELNVVHPDYLVHRRMISRVLESRKAA